jgi:hypothetical protein
MCKKFEHTEWQMLLGGALKPEGLFLDNYYIPKQEVTGATVKNVDCIDKKFIDDNKIMATIHSHCTMSGEFFSGTDDTMTNFNSIIDFHIVTNNKGEFKAMRKVTLPCGLLRAVEVNIQIEDVDVDIKGIENIRRPYETTRCVY